jgi:hypothetical protein
LVKAVYRTPKGRSIHDVNRARRYDEFSEEDKKKIVQLNTEYDIPQTKLAKRFHTSTVIICQIIKEAREVVSKDST